MKRKYKWLCWRMVTMDIGHNVLTSYSFKPKINTADDYDVKNEIVFKQRWNKLDTNKFGQI